MSENKDKQDINKQNSNNNNNNNKSTTTTTNNNNIENKDVIASVDVLVDKVVVSSETSEGSNVVAVENERELEIRSMISGTEYGGPPKKTIYLEDDPMIFDPSDAQLKEDIIRMIIQAPLQGVANEKDEESDYRGRLDRGRETLLKDNL
ncbi:hypothetical protein PPL_09312 [Heterostelium album PN500]|uniref:Uncharacterized protein n=1 Tax=Heterostelium pallidum (strain ATCC 26659 / Pp 5 / PN500) TaxID=670386 RepID=D3BL80_HETP5|nr:hypothetical protein PPL_09312 [Heterostelium album PN500]EFA77814.1 hypothetical protein PPL_09312 [Heterostelium album PN500]|eukprot:XP_020429942.1 hypothetical protein PPL_09312 [Heterostelium album PN500]